MSKLRKSIFGAVALGAAAGAFIAILAPQVPALLREGFPAEIWTGDGRYALVAGTDQALIAPGARIPDAARARFTKAEGRALLVDQGGNMRFETYGPGVDRDSRLNSFSLVKSLIGALVIRAVADRHLTLNDLLSQHLGPSAPKITVGDALTMTSGLIMAGEPAKSVDDAGFSPFGPLAKLHVFGTRAILPDLEVDPAAHGSFAYQSVNTALLGSVLETVYDQPLPKLLSTLIWKPAGASEAHWRMYARGESVSAYCCLYARPVDWLLVGRFLLNNGTPDAPFLPPALWQAMIAPDLPPKDRHSGTYGWHIRHDILDRARAEVQGPFAYFMGHSGQMLYLLPQQDTVVVRFGAKVQLLHSTLYELLSEE